MEFRNWMQYVLSDDNISRCNLRQNDLNSCEMIQSIERIDISIWLTDWLTDWQTDRHLFAPWVINASICFKYHSHCILCTAAMVHRPASTNHTAHTTHASHPPATDYLASAHSAISTISTENVAYKFIIFRFFIELHIFNKISHSHRHLMCGIVNGESQGPLSALQIDARTSHIDGCTAHQWHVYA